MTASHAAAPALPVAANRLSFYLPWRFGLDPADPAAAPPPGSVRRVVEALQRHPDTALRTLAGMPADADVGQPVWQALDPVRAAAGISGEFYPLVTRILCGDLRGGGSSTGGLADGAGIGDAGAPPLQLIKGGASAPSAWLARTPLTLCVHDDAGAQVLRIRLLEAWVRVFGTGVGLLGLALEVSPDAASGEPLRQGTLLRALHALAQPPSRDARPLHAGDRWKVLRGVRAADIPQQGDWLAEQASGPVRVTRDIGQYLAWCKKSGDALLPLYRCVAAVADPPAGDAPPAAPIWSVTVEAIDAEWVNLAPSASALKAGRRLKPSPAGGTMEGSNADDPLATHQALTSTRPGAAGPLLAQRLPGASALIDWMLALLPEGAGLLPASVDAPITAGGADIRCAEPLQRSHTSARLFTYAAVRIRDDGGPVSADALRQLCFRLSRRFDLKYRPAAAELMAGTHLPFETVAHGAATQGAATVVLDDGTEFLKNFLGDAFTKSYLTLGEICQHEYVYLVELQQQSAFRPGSPPDSNDVQRLRSLIQALARFRLYYQFSQISHMAHHNSVLALWRHALGLDRIEADLSRDAGEAHRLLEDDVGRQREGQERQAQVERQQLADAQRRRDEALQHAEALRAKRWRHAAVVGSAAAAFLATSEGVDRWSQRECPPERLSVALTDMQTHGGNLLGVLQELQERMPAVPDSASTLTPLLDRVCADKDLRALAGEVAASGVAPSPKARDPLRTLLASTADDGARDTWAQRLERTCQSTMPFRQCAAQASDWRRRGFWLSIVLAVLAGGLAWRFRPLDGAG